MLAATLIAVCVTISLMQCQRDIFPRPDEIRNPRPIIGIVAQTAYGKLAKHGPSYIAVSYVKYVESAGARVVPIKINQTLEYYNVRIIRPLCVSAFTCIFTFVSA